MIPNGAFRNWSRYLILGTVMTWIGWDVIAYIQGGNPSTESASIIRWSWYFPEIPFCAGILVGHIFFDLREPIDWPKDESK